MRRQLFNPNLSLNSEVLLFCFIFLVRPCDLFGQNEEEIDENEREIVDIDSDSADELKEEELERKK